MLGVCDYVANAVYLPCLRSNPAEAVPEAFNLIGA